MKSALIAAALVGACLVACQGPVFNRFDLMPLVACPGDHLTLEWSAANAVNVTLRAPGVDPMFPNTLNGRQGFTLGSAPLTVSGSANAGFSSATATDTTNIFSPSALSVGGGGRCSDDGSSYIQTVDARPPINFPPSLVIDSVRPPTDREGSISHGGRSAPFRRGEASVAGFGGLSPFGTWTISYALSPTETCRMGDIAGVPGERPRDLPAIVQVRCPTTPPGMPPGIDMSSCGRIGQPCCPTVEQCNSGLMCLAGQCVMGATTCTGSPATPGTTREWVFEVIDQGTRCAIGRQVSFVADSESDARVCLTRAGLVGEPLASLRRHRWHNADTTCLLGSGDFSSLPGDDEMTCARALCGCEHVTIDDPMCP